MVTTGLENRESPLRSEFVQNTCDFCLIPQLETTRFFQNMYGNLGIKHTLDIPGTSVLWTVLQDVVPLAEYGGHLLIMPNKHSISLAVAENLTGLADTTSAVIAGIRMHFPNPIFFFEHGPGFIEEEPVACGGCHLDHAHGHFLLLPQETDFHAIQQSVENILSSAGWDAPSDRAIHSESVFLNLSAIVGIKPYLCMGMIKEDGCQSVIYVQRLHQEHIKSQLMRRVVSSVVYQRPEPIEWHWRDITGGLVSLEKYEELRRVIVQFREITGF